MHACAHTYTLLILVRGLARAAPAWGVGEHQTGPGRGRGHSRTVCRRGLPLGLPQTELNRPYQLSPLCPTRLSWAQCWESGPQPFARDSTKGGVFQGSGWG